MNKKGVEYDVANVLEFVLVLLIIVMFFVAIIKFPAEERINNLKTKDFTLVLDAVSSLKGDIYLNYDLGKGMNVKLENDELSIYSKRELKKGNEQISKNSNYILNNIEGEYNNLFLIKEEGKIKVE